MIWLFSTLGSLLRNSPEREREIVAGGVSYEGYKSETGDPYRTI